MKPSHPEIVNVNLCITSRCNRRCPNCCVGIGINSKGGADLSLNEIATAAGIFGHMRSFNITGGEATFHAQFADLVPHLRHTLQCDELWLETNGYGFRRVAPELFLAFDRIAVTRYGPHVYPDSPSNDDDIAFMQEFLRARGSKCRFLVAEIRHYPRIRREGNACSRAWGGTVSYWNRRLYPCCTAQGMEGAVGIELTPNWRQEIMQVDLPCQFCAFTNNL